MKKVGSFSALLGGDPTRRLASAGLTGGGAAGGPRKFAPKASAPATARADVDDESSGAGEGDRAAPRDMTQSGTITMDVATPISSEKNRPQNQLQQGDFNILQLMSPSDASWFPETYLGAGRTLPGAPSPSSSASSSSASSAAAAPDAVSSFSSAASSALPGPSSSMKPIIRSAPKITATKPSGLALGAVGANATGAGGVIGSQRSLSNPTPILPRPVKVVTIGSSINQDMMGSGSASNHLVDSILGISKPQSSHHGHGGSASGSAGAGVSSSSHGRRDQPPHPQQGKKRPIAPSDAEDGARPKAPRLLPNQPTSLFPFSSSTTSSSSMASGAVAPYLLMGASSLSSHAAANDSHSVLAASSSASTNHSSSHPPPATRTRRRKKSISSSSAFANSGTFPFMFDGLDDNEGGPSAAAASYPFALPSAPWVNGAAANPFTTHAVYLRKKEGGIGLKLKNVGGRAVIRGFSEAYLDSVTRSGQPQQLQVNDIVLSVNHLDAQTSSFDAIVDAFRWVPPSSDWCGLRASSTQAEAVRKRRQLQSSASERDSNNQSELTIPDDINPSEESGPDVTATGIGTPSVNSASAPVLDFLPVASAEDELMAAYPVSLSRVEDVLCVKVMRAVRNEPRLI